MYAVIKTGGKQYRVSAGEKLRVEQILADIGTVLTIDQVLAVGNGEQSLIGEPLVSGAKVSATVLDHVKGDKVRIFKMRRRKHYRKTQGHRQRYTEIFVSGIESSLGSADADAKEALARAAARRAHLASGVHGVNGAFGNALREVGVEPEGAEVSPAPTAATTAADDLTKVEGIGPKIAEVLAAAGIVSFEQLAGTSVERLREILAAAGGRFAQHVPDTWPEQAALAAQGDWDALKTLQGELDGGRRPSTEG